jgi:hypothetical protein
VNKLKMLVVIAGFAAVASIAAWPATAGRGQTITLLAPTGGKTVEIVTNKRGDEHAIGDEFITTEAPLVDPSTKKPVGRMDGIETILSTSADNVALTLRLATGQLFASGERRHPNRVNVLAVTGGTGAYATHAGPPP